MRRMFADIEADVYIMVDGDDTYDAPRQPRRCSSTCCRTISTWSTASGCTQQRQAYRAGHELGNRLLTGLVGMLFRRRIPRHAVGLQGAFATFREVVSGVGARFRDRNRTDRARAWRCAWRSASWLSLQGASRRIRKQAPHVPRRFANTRHHTSFPQGRATPAVVRDARRACSRVSACALDAADPDLHRHGLVPRIPTAILIVGLGADVRIERDRRA